MASGTFRIPPKDLERIQTTFQLDPELITQIASYLESAPLQNTVENLAKETSETIEAKYDDCLNVISLAVAFASAVWRFHKSPQELMDNVVALIEQTDSKFSNLIDVNKWRLDITRCLAGSKAVTCLAKAAALFTEGANLMLECRIISDSRFVFDGESPDIQAGLVIHSLKLDFLGSKYGRESISFQLDDADLRELV